MSHQPAPYFTPENTEAAYQLRYHFGWYTHRRQPLLADAAVRAAVGETLAWVAEARGYHVLEAEVEPATVRALVSLVPGDVPSEVTRAVKGNVAARLRERFGLRELWSRGWFVRSVGARTNEIVRAYIARRFEHHRAVPDQSPELAALARFHADGDPSVLGKAAHMAFEDNLQVVLGTRSRRDFLDPQVAAALIEYWRQVCRKKEWTLWDAELVWNHVHLFLGVHPSESPQQVALSLMNNATHFLHQRYGAVLRQENLDGVWQPGFYVGTVGSATTAQVKAFLQDHKGID